MIAQRVVGSFKDPSGFLFWEGSTLYRKIEFSYQEEYEFFITSGLYDDLVRAELLIKHTEVTTHSLFTNVSTFKIIKPEIIPFISYPYEWSFSQLKDAALLTLAVQKRALAKGMILKDATAYNVQFKNGKPIFIDTLSFERYQPGSSWKAYKQFCQHFLAPLALMCYRDVRLNQLFTSWMDGIPLDLASTLLPLRTYGRLPLLLHIHLHARFQRRYENETSEKLTSKKLLSRSSLDGLLDNLTTGITSLSLKKIPTEWSNYYHGDSYSAAAFEDKKRAVSEFLLLTQAKVVCDLGANDGFFSRVAAGLGAFVLSCDSDTACVENNYCMIKKSNEKSILPLYLDVTNPSSALGWSNKERLSFTSRGGPIEVVLALALLHHLAISHNVPFSYIAEYFSNLCTWLIIEFIPKEDKKVQKLLATREDIFVSYDQKHFEQAFKPFFDMVAIHSLHDSVRTLYLMKKKA